MQPSRYKPVSLFQAICQEQYNQLVLKNYSKKMINSNSQSGLFFNQLKAALKNVVDDTFWQYQLVVIPLAMTGHFGRGKDKVCFDFSYQYDPATAKLNLMALKATMNDEWEKTYTIAKNPLRNLPAAALVHQDLSKIRSKDILARIQNTHRQTFKPGAKKGNV